MVRNGDSAVSRSQVGWAGHESEMMVSRKLNLDMPIPASSGDKRNLELAPLRVSDTETSRLRLRLKTRLPLSDF